MVSNYSILIFSGYLLGVAASISLDPHYALQLGLAGLAGCISFAGLANDRRLLEMKISERQQSRAASRINRRLSSFMEALS